MSDLCTILCGDALERLQTLPDESVQCCVCSPPYWGLRDYGTAAWMGGDENCNHLRVNDRRDPKNCKQTTNAGTSRLQFCDICGARRIDSQLGLEKTPEEYVTEMVKVFREVRRVLKDDGTLWLNLGDSYAGGKQGNDSSGDSTSTLNNGGRKTKTGEKMPSKQRKPPLGLKQKDLVGIPWMVAFALRADGWYLRSDIIWAKPNPMPESVTDRPTKAHEYFFLLTKSRKYFYDADAIADQTVGTEYDRTLRPRDRMNGTPSLVRGRHQIKAGATLGLGSETRNKRSVWTVTTQSYSDAHFATYPPDLIKPCILAGCPIGGMVLDPFAGSGTTGMVALELGRKAILIELNPEYVKLIEKRLGQTTSGFHFA